MTKKRTKRETMVKAQCEKCGAVVAFERKRVGWGEGPAGYIIPGPALMGGLDYVWCPFHGGARYYLRRPEHRTSTGGRHD